VGLFNFFLDWDTNVKCIHVHAFYNLEISESLHMCAFGHWKIQKTLHKLMAPGST